MYRANWINGYIDKWNNEDQNWKRKDSNMFVILKSFNNTDKILSEFMNKVYINLLSIEILRILIFINVLYL